MSEKVIKDAIDAFNKGDGAALGKLFGGGRGKGAAAAVKDIRAGFPDLTYKLDHVHTEGDQVYFSYTAKGTNSGKYEGAKASNKAASWTGSGIATIVDGKIAGLRVNEDAIRRGIQLGRPWGQWGGGTTANPSMTGNWSGSAQGVTVTLALVQTGTSVTGTATAFGGSFPVTGTNNYPNVNLSGNMNGIAVSFSGAFANANSIPGTLTAMGSSLAVTLNRQ